MSAGGKLQAIDRSTGVLVWQKGLYENSPDEVRACGYAASPIAFNHTIIAPIGGVGAIAVFRMQDSAVLWRKHELAIGYSSPLLINVDGQTQLVMSSPDKYCGEAVPVYVRSTGLSVDAEAEILEGVAWTPPTVADDILLLHNRRIIAAYSLPTTDDIGMAR